VPGGINNKANGDFSFAAGKRAIVSADHSGVFLFSDSSDSDFTSENTNEFAIRATGGVRIVTSVSGNGNPESGVTLSSGSGSWSTLSDRSVKANFSGVDINQILESIVSLPISEWSYTGEEANIRHIGPMAQDFYTAFGLGTDERHISNVDADGVALAPIQGLYRLIEERDYRIEIQDKQIATLDERIAALERTNYRSTIIALGLTGAVIIRLFICRQTSFSTKK